MEEPMSDYLHRFEILKTLAGIINKYSFDSYGTCRSLGCTEGEQIETLYFDAEERGDEEFGDQETTGHYRVFEASLEERQIFGAEPGRGWFVIETSSAGLLYGAWKTDAELGKLRDDVEAKLVDEL
jgi:hypothetical protein